VTDFVLNHTSDEHPWFRESRASRDNPKRDWYVWRDGRSLLRPPNRWKSVAEGKAWTRDAATGQHYYHAFLDFQPDLNWRNPEVRDAMFDIARFWLDRGVDGFRLDLINFLYEDDQLRDNPRAFGRRPYFWQRHIYDRSRPESIESVKELRGVVDGYEDRAILGEVCSDERADSVALLGCGTDALHLSFYLDFARCPWKAEAFREAVGWLEEHLPAGGWHCYYLDNHDLERSITRLGAGPGGVARAKVAAAMLLTLRGTPIIYAGQEIGMPTSKVPLRKLRDPLGKIYWPLSRGRDGSRTPMQWDASSGAGFTSGTPWLPVDPSFRAVNVERQIALPDSLLNWYRTLIRVRAEHACLQTGSYRVLPDTPQGVWVYVRECDGDTIVVALNFTPRRRSLPASLAPASGAKWRLLASSDTSRDERPTAPIALAPHEALVLEES